MDPVTAAIIAGLSASAIAGVPKAAEQVIADAYAGLKALITRKFGGESDVAKAVAGLESKLDSAGRKETLGEEVKAARVDQDPEILKAAQALMDQIKAVPGGAQHIQNAVGSYIAQADRGGTASVNVNQPR